MGHFIKEAVADIVEQTFYEENQHGCVFKVLAIHMRSKI